MVRDIKFQARAKVNINPGRLTSLGGSTTTNELKTKQSGAEVHFREDRKYHKFRRRCSQCDREERMTEVSSLVQSIRDQHSIPGTDGHTYTRVL